MSESDSEASVSTSAMGCTASKEGASASEMPAHIAIPQLADYRISFDPFETGGQGEIFRAKCKIRGDFAIIKVVEKTNDNIITMVETEIMALSRLRKRDNVVDLLKSFQTSEFAYLIMEYIDGITMESLFKLKYKFSWPVILETLRQLCVALDVIKTMNIIHRDINPRNVMISRNGMLKIIDFGMCRLRSDETDMHRPDHYKIDLHSSAMTMCTMFTCWISDNMLSPIWMLDQQEIAIELLCKDIFKTLRIKRCDERILVVLENWLKSELTDRLDSSVWLNNNHFPDPLEKILYTNEIFPSAQTSRMNVID